MTAAFSPPASERLAGLAERCEAASGPDRELDALVNAACCIAIIPCEQYPTIEAWASSAMRHGWNVPRYTASLGAAMSLVPEGADWYVTSVRPLTGRFAGAVYDGPHPRIEYAEAATPALALCAASLRARAHQETRP